MSASQPKRTVGELLEVLSKFDPSTPVMAMWEATWNEVRVYTAKDGTVVLDADDEHDRAHIEAGTYDWCIPSMSRNDER